jgi:hypothetical protein
VESHSRLSCRCGFSNFQQIYEAVQRRHSFAAAIRARRLSTRKLSVLLGKPYLRVPANVSFEMRGSLKSYAPSGTVFESRAIWQHNTA